MSSLVLVGLLALYALLVLRTAWICDDAFITFRTVDNFLHGHGLTWNPPARVQTFTHPLWLFLLTPVHALTGSALATAVVLGALVSLLAVLVLVRALPGQKPNLTAPKMRKSPGQSWIYANASITLVPALLVLIFSKAFIDYSTSGLENPLTQLLLALFYVAFWRGALDFRWTMRRFATLAFLAGLLALNRMDTLLLVLPALALAFWQTRPRARALGWLALGFAPFLLWELFSLAYYGFLFPNTAYAKLSTGIPAGELAAQGLRYFRHTLRFDPLTPIVMLAGVALPFLRGVAARAARIPHRDGTVEADEHRADDHHAIDRTAVAVSAGILLYLLYILFIGGDFMGGRFFTAPLFASVALGVATLTLTRKRALVIASAIVILGVAPHLGLPQALFGTGRPSAAVAAAGDEAARFIDRDGIADERGYYALPGRALFPAPPDAAGTRAFGREQGEALRSRGAGLVLEGAIGELGYYAGPRLTVLDYYGLTDPLLARMPTLRFDPFGAVRKPEASNWRVGHFLRAIPEGYLQSLMTGEDHIRDREIAQWSSRLDLITRGPLGSGERLREILRLNFGGQRPMFDRTQYVEPKRVSLAELAPAPPSEGSARGGRAVRFSFNGLQVVLPDARRAERMTIELDPHTEYTVVYYRGASILAAHPLAPRVRDARGMVLADIETPPAAAQTGFDRLGFFPRGGDGFATVGSIQLP
ncbi:MAG: hypothetical protein KBD56_00430 [Candidatus Eisenbacteria bacterium]|nr:hypothetical protein [Candidatus Eisenbacteria bacterium]